MKTKILLSKTNIFRSPGLFFGCPKSYILDHWEFMKAIVLLIPGSKARKSSNQASWDWSCRLLDPCQERHQIEAPGIGFVDFLSQCWKVIKSSLLGFVLSHRFTIPAQYYIRKHFVIGSLFIGSPVCGSSAYSPSRRGTHEKCVSMQKCFHNDWSAAAFTSHTLLLPAESALHEV